MRRSMVFTLSLLCILVFISSTVFAWDDLIFLGGGAGVGDPGNVWGGLNLRYSTASDMYDSDSEKQELADDMTGMLIPIRGHYNIIENLQAFAILPIVSVDDGTDSESGIGDIWLGAKYAVMPEGLLTVRGALDIPTGDDEKGLGNAGGFGIDVAALARKDIEKLRLRGQLGIRYNGEDGDTKWKPGIGFYATGGVRYTFTEKFRSRIGLIYFNQGDGEADGTEISDSTVNWLELYLGPTFTINENLFAFLDLEYTLTGTNTKADLGILIGIAYHIME